MTGVRVFITGAGMISAAGEGIAAHRAAMKEGTCGIGPLTLFSAPNPMPVGEIRDRFEKGYLPRTHRLALIAASEAMQGVSDPPDAVIVGTTTGGMLLTEELLKQGVREPDRFRYHGLGTVAQLLADAYRCTGPQLTISTACSSGTAALKIALELIRSGKAHRVLAGGADCLCRLTFHGFKSLQLIDPEGAKPFDRDRRGMSVGEAGAMLLLQGGSEPPENALAEIMGCGLSCDAYHPTTPHPEGIGAAAAMRDAMADAGISPDDVEYINLHGTGTRDNDLSEGIAIEAVFGEEGPPISSVKGALGHSLGAAGAAEAILCALAIKESVMPGNVGWKTADPQIGPRPIASSVRKDIRTALSNTFGFGGNNASILLGRAQGSDGRAQGKSGKDRIDQKGGLAFRILGTACFTGAGDFTSTLDQLERSGDCRGQLSLSEISEGLSPGVARRMKRLPRLALALGMRAWRAAEEKDPLSGPPSGIFWGTGWGPLSETHDFLTQLFQSEERFAGPTDFIGSVHNAPAGHLAAHFMAQGPNITATGRDVSFEQALMCAGMLTEKKDGPFLVLAADEYHPELSPLFDPNVGEDPAPSDGGGAFCLERAAGEASKGLKLIPGFLGAGAVGSEGIAALLDRMISALGGSDRIKADFAAILAGIPAHFRKEGVDQLGGFMERSGFAGPVIDYRKAVGEHAAASAVAAVLASSWVQQGKIPGSLVKEGFLLWGAESDFFCLDGRGILLLGLGHHVSAVEVMP